MTRLIGPIQNGVVDVHVTLEGRGDLAARIYRQLLDAVLDGRLRSGERLPPTRELAQRLEVSRNTVSVAYERLTAEGFLLAGRLGHVRGHGTGAVASGGPQRAIAGRGRGGECVHGRVGRCRRRWQTATGAGLRLPRGRAGLASVPAGNVAAAGQPSYRGPRSDPTTRARRASRPAEAIARYVGVSRSVRASADDVVVTQGAQQALDLIAPGADRAGDVRGGRGAGLPTGAASCSVVWARASSVSRSTPRASWSPRIPQVGAPGLRHAVAPVSARHADVVRRAGPRCWRGPSGSGAVVIEDDYDSEFRFADRPLEPLQSLDRSGRVIYVGSFSKTMLPMLRLGFLVAPASLQPALRSREAARRLARRPAHPGRAGPLPRRRHARAPHPQGDPGVRRPARADLDALRRDFADWLDVVPSAAGLHVCTRVVSDSVDVAAVVRAAARAEVAVQPLAKYCGETPVHDGLVIGYGAVRPERIPDGLRLLAAAFRHAHD